VLISRRAFAAWAGTDRIPSVRARLAHLQALPVTRASALLALFVAGVEVDGALVPPLDDDLIERAGDRVRARVAILPIGEALIVCDRADASETAELVCWPDDSSLHLISSIPPGRRARWLDLGCGSAVAPLVRPALADRLVASDLNPRAIRYAQLGARLSKVALETLVGDLAVEPAELVTCNAPIPRATPAGGPIWRATDDAFIPRMLAAARAALVPGGLIVMHTALDAVPDLPAAWAGEVVTIAYTPPDAPRQFAITWWRPDARDRVCRARRLLDPARPHLDHQDRETALSGNLPEL
jgi:hypothetical protein